MLAERGVHKHARFADYNNFSTLSTHVAEWYWDCQVQA